MKIFLKPFRINKLSAATTAFFMVLIGLAGCSDNSQENGNNVRSPKGLVATAGTRTVTLDWSGVATASRYTVYWSHKKDVSKHNGAAIEISAEQPHYVHKGLANNTTYYYVITSQTNTGESGDSNRVEATPKPAVPAQPQVTETVAGDGRVTLYWGNDTLGASTYALYWLTEPGVSVKDGNRIDDVRSPFVHSNRENGQDYYYVLVAENPYGQGPASAIATATPQKATPTAPIITALTLTTGQIELSWQDVGEAQTYTLYWNTMGGVSNADAAVEPVTSPYIHAPLANGTYYYRLQGKNGTVVSALSNQVQGTLTTPLDRNAKVINLPSVNPPDTPTGLIRELHEGRLTLRWNPSDGAIGYNLYWKAASNSVTKITNIQSPYTHTGLTNGETYYYRVSAINDGGESALSEEINGIPQVIVPGVPAGVTALAGDLWVAVRWDDVENASGYNVQYNGEVASNVMSPYTISGLINGTAYNITVTAINGSNESQPSDPAVTVTPRQPPPNAPQNVTAQPQAGQVIVQWDASTQQDPSDSGEAITEYRVYYNTRSGVNISNGKLAGSTIPLSPDGRQQFIHTALTNGQKYFYVVSAKNASGGQSRLSQEAWARPQVPIPDAPSNAWTQPGDNKVVVNFTPAQNALSHNLYWTKTLADGSRSDVQVDTNFQPGSSFTEGPNTNGNTYYFQVSAFNNGGESKRTPEISARPQVAPPQNPPQNLMSQAGNTRVTISWDAMTDINLVGYAIYWSTTPEIDPVTSVPILVDNTKRSYTHSSLQNGLTYYYQIVARNAGGESTLSEAVIARPQMPAPSAPALAPVATAGDATVTLDWPQDPAATSYTIYQHSNNQDPLYLWQRINGVVPGYTQQGLINKQTYFYRLSASSLGGESGLSPIVSATPLAPLPSAPANLTVTAGDTRVTLNWNTVAEMTYTLYWTTDPTVDPIKRPNKLNGVRPVYVHKGLKNNTAYHYQLTASNASSAEGAPTAVLSATPQSQAGINNPPVFSNVPSDQMHVDGEVITAFTLNATDTDNNTIVYSANNLPQGISINRGSGQISGKIDTLASVNSPYVVNVTADDQTNAPNATATVNFTWTVNIVPPQAPVLQNPIVAGSTIDLNWNFVTGQTYNLYRSTLPNIDITTATPIGPDLLIGTYSDNATLPGLDYYYVVTTTKTGLVSSASNEVAGVVMLAGQGFLGLSADDKTLMSIDSSTGVITPISGNGLSGFDKIRRIAYDDFTKQIYGINLKAGTTQLIRIDPNTANATLIGYAGTEFAKSVGLVFDSISGLLYSLNADGNLYSLSPASLISTLIGSANIVSGFNGFSGLAMDAAAGILYSTTSGINAQLVSINPSVALPGASIGSPIGKLTTAIEAMSYDSNSSQLIGSTGLSVAYIDKNTATIFPIGEVLSTGTVTGMALAVDAVVPSNSILYRMENGQNSSSTLAKINLPDYGGLKISRIPRSAANIKSITYDPSNNVIYALDNSLSDQHDVIAIDPVTAKTSIKASLMLKGVSGLEINTSNSSILYVIGGAMLNEVNTTDWTIRELGSIVTKITDMAYDNSGTGTLYGLSGNDLVTIDRTPGTAGTVTKVNTISAPGIAGLSIVTVQTVNGPVNKLYGISGSTNSQLVEIDKNTAQATPVLSNLIRPAGRLTGKFDSNTGNSFVYMLDTVTRELVRLDLGGNAFSAIGNYDLKTPALAYDSISGTHYAVDLNSGKLFTIDPISGAFDEVGPLGAGAGRIVSIAFDVNSLPNKLYGLNQNLTTGEFSLMEIDTNKGPGPLARPLFTLGANITDIAFNEMSGIGGDLYAINDTTHKVLKVDVAGQSVTVSNSFNFRTLNYLTYQKLGRFIAIGGVSRGSSIVTIDAVSGVTSSLGLSALSGDIVFDSLNDTLYCHCPVISNTPIDKITVSPIGVIGKPALKALAYDNTIPNSGVLFAIDSLGDLIRIDDATGSSVRIGQTGYYDIQSLVFDGSSAVLYGVDNTLQQLTKIDIGTGIGFAVGTGLGLTVKDLAIDSTGAIFALAQFNQLVEIDKQTGSQISNPINLTNVDGTTPADIVRGISIDSKGTMFGVISAQVGMKFDNLVTIDRVTAKYTILTSGKIGFSFIGLRSGLTINKNTNTLFSERIDSLLSINTTTGAGTTIGVTSQDLQNLSYDSINNIVYGIDSSGSHLFIVDPINGNSTFVKELDYPLGMRGLAYDVSNGGVLYSVARIVDNTGALMQKLVSFDLLNSPSIPNPGTVGFSDVFGLDFNTANGMLYGIDNTTKKLFTIKDLASGAGAAVGNSSISSDSFFWSLVYSPSDNIFFTASQNIGEGALVLIEPATGVGYKKIPFIPNALVYGLTVQPQAAQ